MDRCEVCGATGDFDRLALREMLFGLRETFTYVRCPSCGVLRIEAVPTDLARYYPPEYFAGAGEPSPSRHLGRLAGLADRAGTRRLLFGRGRLTARLLRPWAPPALPETRAALPIVRLAGLRSLDDPIIDVGCGRIPGQLLRLRKSGFRSLLGIDPYLEGDSDYMGIPLRRRSIHDQSGAFKLVTLHHSFEHVPDPFETLAAARRLLRPDGVLLIRTPVMGTWFWETYGTSWWELDAPRHLFVHTRESLERLARDVGLELFSVRWDSTYVELIASEQIKHDIAWREPASWARNPPGMIPPELEAQFRVQVKQLNTAGRAGRAGYYFRRIDAAGRGAEP